MPNSSLNAKDRLIFALDVPDTQRAVEFVRQLHGEVGMFKVGLELFIGEGPDVLKAIRDHSDAGIFLDLKLHDIPATVRGAVQSAGKHGVQFLTVHCSGGEAMLTAAAEAAGPSGVQILGVTVLTHMTGDDLTPSQGYGEGLTPHDLVLARAALAQQCGCPGVVCSGEEVASLQKKWGDSLIRVVPGIRPAAGNVKKDDQSRAVTPAQAIQAGADYLVVGRPIREASDPRETARQIVKEIDDALKSR